MMRIIPGQRISDYTGISVLRRWGAEDTKFKVIFGYTVIYLLCYIQRQQQDDQEFKSSLVTY